jgi:hypothetical protein
MSAWTNDVCAQISSVTPDHASPFTATDIIVEGTFPFLPILGLSCYFNEISSPLTVLSPTSFTCQTPVIVSRKRQDVVDTLTLSVRSSASMVYLTHPGGFDLVNCFVDAFDRCSTCQDGSEARCGWCVEGNYCGLHHDCNGRVINKTDDCPFLEWMEPLTGHLEGGTTVTIIGNGYVNSTNLTCVFADTHVPAKYKNFTAITCNTPPSDVAQQISVTVYYFSRQFTTNSLSFQYVEEDSDDGVPLDIALGVGLGLVGLMVIVIAAAVIIVRRRLAKKRLREP